MEAFLPTAKGYLPYYLLGLSIVAIGNSIQNYVTLHYTRRIYNGLFVRNNPSLSPGSKTSSSSDPEDSVNKLVPISSSSSSSSSSFSSSSSSSSSSSAPPDTTREQQQRAKRSDAAAVAVAEDQVTPLAARLFGTYTLVISVVRVYAAYNMDSAPMYQLGIMTYVVAWVHFVSELVVFKTQKLGKPQMLPLGFATGGIVWMVSQYGFYVEG